MNYEVLIVGGGISGCALAYELVRYTDIKKIAVVEKYEDLATLNSKATSNSQTIHFGDIETNYTLAKAKITKRTAKMAELYCLQHNYQNEIVFKHQKMAMGVGDAEVEFMLERFEEFLSIFPTLEVWDKERLKTLEPAVVYDRDGKERRESIVGVGIRDEWSTIDYGKMAHSFIENGKKEHGKEIDLFLNCKIENIESLSGGGFVAKSSNRSFSADFVVVNAGAHSLYLAHKMGYGLELACLPVAGSFYMSKRKILNGKVYMVQNPKLPFAALHGDPDILADGNTRFGPTALVLPKLERYKSGTYLDFWKTLRFDSAILEIFKNLLSDSEIRSYIFRNMLFELPLIDKGLFVKDARKIIPSLKESDIEYAKGFGGVRPQVLNKKEKRLVLGEASINPNNGIIFNMTPSPGATSCLGNGERDMRFIVQFLGKKYDEARFLDELTEKESCSLSHLINEQKQYASKLRGQIHRHEELYYNHERLEGRYWEAPYSPWTMDRKHWSM